MTKGLEPPDKHHLNAAEGWLGLGNAQEAWEELSRLSVSVASHPEVLRVKYHLYEKTRDWEPAAEVAQLLCQVVPEAPFGWVHMAYALHELRRTREAYNVLMPVVDRFPEEYVIRYNLACYCCQLGQREEARAWIKRAIALVGGATSKKLAYDDPDLEPMKKEIGEI